MASSSNLLYRSLTDVILLTEKEEEQVLESINYSRTQLSMDLSILREWIGDQEHLPPSRLTETDDFFVNFLVGCKGSLEKSKRKLDRYYTLRRKNSGLADRSPSCFLDNFEQALLVTMPRSLQGHQVAYLKLLTSDGFDILALLRRITFFVEVQIRLPGITAGVCGVIDCELVTASVVPALSPTILKDASAFLTEAVPNRCLQYYFINCSTLLETVFNRVFKPLMSKKLAARFVYLYLNHGQTNDEPNRVLFCQMIRTRRAGNIGYLQGIKDGCNSPFESRKQFKLVEASLNVLKAASEEQKEFLNRLQELTDESKRPAELVDVDDTVFGVQGSIKNLNID